jgi:cytochrome c peroxidase
MLFDLRAQSLFLVLSALAAACAAPPSDGEPEAQSEAAQSVSSARTLQGPSIKDSFDKTGVLRTIDLNGPIDENGPFFQSFGTNGRRCSTCHVENDAWTITPRQVQDRFDDTDGTDPLFRPVDGSNSPNLPVVTKDQRRKAYSMLLTKALIRVGLPIPAGAEFELATVDDPYKFASAAELSLFRRPLPTTNLKFLATVMWDGRETVAGQAITADLAHQSNDATIGHARATTPLPDAVRQQIVDFETGLFTAQILDNVAGDLRDLGAKGGPQELITQPFFLGINDPLGHDPSGAAFDPNVFTIYERWAKLPVPSDHCREGGADARKSIARGEDLFNNLPITITGVAGLNDDLHEPALAGHCTTCHDTPSSGNHSISAPLNIGLTDASRRTPDMPLYTLRNVTTHATIQTTDPGRALITGQWKDIGRFKGPILRGLAGRAPYFHNGFAADLDAVIDFYDQRFDLDLTTQQHDDLVRFLSVL